MYDLFEIGAEGWWFSLFQVVMIDLTLAADNAIVIGMAARNLHGHERRKAIFFGIMAATVIRIIFAIFTMELLQIVGLLLMGGLLLLYVAWKKWRELRADHIQAAAENSDDCPVTFRRAILNIIIADISMSLDNVLAVAGAAREHMDVLVIGLVFSIGLMGIASTWVAKLLEKYRWLAYIGLGIVLYVALSMIYEGWHEVAT